MNRHYYFTEDLDELQAVENDLEESGVAASQIHVLSDKEVGAQAFNMDEVESLIKRDMGHNPIKSVFVGLVYASLVLVLAWLSGLPATLTWVPFALLAIVVFGFCTWDGGLLIKRNSDQDLQLVQNVLHQGRHVLLVDVDDRQEMMLHNIMAFHPEMEMAAAGEHGAVRMLGAH